MMDDGFFADFPQQEPVEQPKPVPEAPRRKRAVGIAQGTEFVLGVCVGIVAAVLLSARARPFGEQVLMLGKVVGVLFVALFMGGILVELLRIAWQDNPCRKIAGAIYALAVFLFGLLWDVGHIFIPAPDAKPTPSWTPIDPDDIDPDQLNALDAALDRDFAPPVPDQEPRTRT